MANNFTNWPKNMPNGHEIYQHLPLKGPQNLPKMGFLG
jgi:hypothetical protein